MISVDQVTLVIPPLGRIQRQRTLGRLPPEWHKRTWLAVPEREAPFHAWPQLFIHPNIEGIAATRQWIFDTIKTDYVFCFDDDCDFNIRRQYNPPRMRGPATPDEVGAMLIRLVSWLERGIVLVGVSARQNNDKVNECCSAYPQGRLYRVWGYRRAAILEMDGFRFDAVHSVDDFHLALSVLRQGYPIRITYHWAHDDRRGSGAPGGCALNRTPATQAADAHRLAALHPGYVEPVERSSHATWKEWGTRMDMQIQWHRAFMEGHRQYPGRTLAVDCDCGVSGPRLL